MATTRYAAGSEVPVDRSRAEIERILKRFGADQFLYGWEDGRSIIGFRLGRQTIRMTLDLPDPDDPMIRLTKTGLERSASAAQAEFERETRRRWRSLALVIKAMASQRSSVSSCPTCCCRADRPWGSGSARNWTSARCQVCCRRVRASKGLRERPSAARQPRVLWANSRTKSDVGKEKNKHAVQPRTIG